MLRTPSPVVKKPKFDLSELDDKQKPMIPEPRPELAQETEKVQKPAKISRKKRNFAAMLGGSTAAGSTAFGTGTALTNDGMGAFSTPFGYPT